jgi:hypothetical protein
MFHLLVVIHIRGRINAGLIQVNALYKKVLCQVIATIHLGMQANGAQNKTMKK